jgi:DNA invertase Pin-like site-specific DNA recombinase
MPGKPRKSRKSQAEVTASFKRHGEGNGQAKMNEAKVRELRQLYEAGTKTNTLAAKYEIGRGTVFNIAARRTWAHVA